MPNRDVEYNLLLGILALQMDFIDRDALTRAVASWVADKSQPLDQILRKQKAIDSDTQAILAKLARKRADAAGPDPHRSFFSPALIEVVGEGLGRFRDADVEALLARLRNATWTEVDPYATRVDGDRPGAKPPPGTIAEAGRFRVLHLLARGGLGEVFVARDEELHRQVALKQLQDRYADHSESRLRFLLEAEVTGALEHPGIVPVYGLGRYPDGRPYYAMRLVDGSSLRDAIGAFHEAGGDPFRPGPRSVEFRKLLGRFRGVCDTVAFAHDRGVLHRDLKPSNIMLGRFGETLVVDWGLAKTFAGPDGAGRLVRPSAGEDRAETLVGVPIGTPSYMSPEQAAGQVDRLGPASDVYSLGATLYHLLTGRAPFEVDDISKTVERVRRGQFVPPHRARRGVPAPLAMICLKAMAMAPEARYPSPEDLADDVDRWLAGEPVSVYRDWLPRRVWRWGRVHPWVVGSVGIMTFFVILVFLLSAFVLAIPGVLLAIVGGLVGSLAGAVRGKFALGARQGSALAFRIGMAVGVILFVLGIAYEAFVLPRAGSRPPAVDGLDAYHLASSRWAIGDRAGARSWYDWAERQPRRAPGDARRPEVDRARAEAARLLGLPGPNPR